MVAKIGRASNLYGALAYNHLKVEKENGQVLLTNKIIETPNGHYSVSQLVQSFEPYLIANRNTEKTTLHISLNPDPKDDVSDDEFKLMAQQYMQEMGYAQQPFVVFKHTDIERTHIHIVSVCVDEEGKKISDKFEKRRSMKVCRELERKHGLIPATEKEHQQNNKIFRQVNYQTGNIKSQIASVIRHLPKYYQFQTLGQYNALLSLFNITAEKVEGELHGKPQQGLLYFALNDKGEKASNPFKASLFGKNAGLSMLELHFEKCKKTLKSSGAKETLKAAITIALQSVDNEKDFKKQLIQQGINVVVRRNDTGRIYGITFIDHNSKTIWNGSHLGTALTANTFNDYWNNSIKPETKDLNATKSRKHQQNTLEDVSIENPHKLFDFLNKDANVFSTNDTCLLEDMGGLLTLMQGEDFEELDFENQMKKKRKRKSNRK